MKFKNILCGTNVISSLAISGVRKVYGVQGKEKVLNRPFKICYNAQCTMHNAHIMIKIYIFRFKTPPQFQKQVFQRISQWFLGISKKCPRVPRSMSQKFPRLITSS